RHKGGGSRRWGGLRCAVRLALPVGWGARPPPTPPSHHRPRRRRRYRRLPPPAALQLCRDAPVAAFGRALEEQRLARHRRDRRWLERLGDQERRLGPLTGQEALGIGGDEDLPRLERCEQLGCPLRAPTCLRQ